MKLFRRKGAPAGTLHTARLELRPITTTLLDAEHAGLAPFSAALKATVSPRWPPLEWEPHVRAVIALQCAEQPGTAGWHRYVVLRAGNGASARLVGCLGGFPKAPGEVEIGYSTLPEFQRRGYASEAAMALVDWLLLQNSVTHVTAQAFLNKPESIKVMQRCGMTLAGAGDDAGTVRYRRARSLLPAFDR